MGQARNMNSEWYSRAKLTRFSEKGEIRVYLSNLEPGWRRLGRQSKSHGVSMPSLLVSHDVARQERRQI